MNMSARQQWGIDPVYCDRGPDRCSRVSARAQASFAVSQLLTQNVDVQAQPGTAPVPEGFSESMFALVLGPQTPG